MDRPGELAAVVGGRRHVSHHRNGPAGRDVARPACLSVPALANPQARRSRGGELTTMTNGSVCKATLIKKMITINWTYSRPPSRIALFEPSVARTKARAPAPGQGAIHASFPGICRTRAASACGASSGAVDFRAGTGAGRPGAPGLPRCHQRHTGGQGAAGG